MNSNFYKTKKVAKFDNLSLVADNRPVSNKELAEDIHNISLL